MSNRRNKSSHDDQRDDGNPLKKFLDDLNERTAESLRLNRHLTELDRSKDDTEEAITALLPLEEAARIELVEAIMAASPREFTDEQWSFGFGPVAMARVGSMLLIVAKHADVDWPDKDNENLPPFPPQATLVILDLDQFPEASS
jgi:hypothetical protein